MRLKDSADTAWLWKVLGCGGCAVGCIYVIGWLLAGMFLPLRIIGQSVTCQASVFHMTRAFRMYADDFDDRLPPATGWMERTMVYVDKEPRFHCPAVASPGENLYGYAMNEKVSAKPLDKIDDPDETPVVYDSTNLARSVFDPVATLPRPGRHRTRPRKESPSKIGNFIGYVGGNARIKLDSPSTGGH